MRIVIFLFALSLQSNLLVAQRKHPLYFGLSTPIRFETAEKIQANEEVFTEIISQRDEFKAHYKSNKGTYKTIVSNQPLHFLSNNQWTPISKKLIFNLVSKHWEATQQPIPVLISQNGGFKFNRNGEWIESLGCESFNGVKPIINSFYADENGLEFHDIMEGVDLQVNAIQGGVEFSYILTEPLTLNNSDLMIVQKIKLPEQARLVIDENSGYYAGKEWKGDLLFIDVKGNEIGRWRGLIAYDQMKEFSLGSYSFKQEGEIATIEMRIDQNWLSSSERTFPIIIDPIVAGTPVVYNGPAIPSCLQPTFAKDSLLVPVPAGISLTGLYVEGNYYADPFTGATMGMGNMFFSTSCASSQYFTITGALANTPGTAYLDSFNLLNPLSCCFPKTCTDTAIYVKFNLGRTALGSGCNTTYIRYDPFSQWPFRVVVYGKTPESYGNEWYVSQTPICSNICEFTATGYARYGVPPYTFTHPWSQDTVVAGSNNGCSVGATNNLFTLKNPNCPIYCDTLLDELQVPPPVIIDACGNQIMDIPFGIKPLKTASYPVANYDSTICNGSELNFEISACIPEGNVTLFGNGINTQVSFSQFLNGTQDSVTVLNYSAFSTANGCISDTVSYPVYIIPNPQAILQINPNPCVVETPFVASSNSVSNSGNISQQLWYLDSNAISIDTSFSSTIDFPGVYPLCLVVEDLLGCRDTVCQNLVIIPAEIENINTITPNGDGINDVLYFDYLDFYNESEIIIFNRWGNEIYSASPYLNDWTPEGLTDGIYFYILKIKDNNQRYSSFFHLIR